MKISAIELRTFAEQDQEGQLLVLRTDSVLFAAGEIAPSARSDQTERSIVILADLLVGRDPFDVELLLADAKSVDGSIADIALVSAATAAMLDLAAQSLEVPIHQLLGGRVHDRVRACAVGWAEDATGRRELAAAARRTVAAGYTMLRVEPFASSLTQPAKDVVTALELVEAVRAEVPEEVDLVVAADGALNVSAAMKFAQSLHSLEPIWLEDPVAVWPIEPLTHVSERATQPLAAGRGARPDILRKLSTANLVDHLVLEVGRVGGLIEARRIAALAEVSHIGVVPIGSGGSISLSAALQLAAVLPNLSAVEVRPGLAVVEAGTVSIDDRPRLAFVPESVSQVV
jgi:galactonate dehydratase